MTSYLKSLFFNRETIQDKLKGMKDAIKDSKKSIENIDFFIKEYQRQKDVEVKELEEHTEEYNKLLIELEGTIAV